jgi:cytochrome c oxidase subunit 2
MVSPNTSNGFNLPMGVTEISHEIYNLHMLVFWICVGIAVVVFGAMIYSLVKFRHSQGAVADTAMVHSTKVEIIWTVIPVIILVFMAVPAAETILKMEDTRNSELSIRVTGYQWKWQYQYMGDADGINYFSTLAQDSNFARELHSGVDPKSVPNYLLSVDKPLVVPSGTKVRLLLTSQDVIHAWWVPDFGAKRDAIPANAPRCAAAIMDSCRSWSTCARPTTSRNGSKPRKPTSNRPTAPHPRRPRPSRLRKS